MRNLYWPLAVAASVCIAVFCPEASLWAVLAPLWVPVAGTGLLFFLLGAALALATLIGAARTTISITRDKTNDRD